MKTTVQTAQYSIQMQFRRNVQDSRRISRRIPGRSAKINTTVHSEAVVTKGPHTFTTDEFAHGPSGASRQIGPTPKRKRKNAKTRYTRC